MKNYKHFYSALRVLVLLTCLPLMTLQTALAEPNEASKKSAAITKEEQELISLSKKKWQWMAERNIDTLAALFHDKAVFVHMSRTMTKQQELDVIKSGGIHYKKADIHEVSVNIVGSTAILLNKITLLAEVRGKEVTNPFVVTEVYVKDDSNWKIASLSFTRLVTPENN
ncbi:MAG: nuclear transport factor 2 family protein [Pseudomonadota bacterium]